MAHGVRRVVSPVMLWQSREDLVLSVKSALANCRRDLSNLSLTGMEGRLTVFSSARARGDRPAGVARISSRSDLKLAGRKPHCLASANSWSTI